jgi:DNA polymerase
VSAALDQLAPLVRACTQCVLSQTRTHVVVGDFPEDARFMLVGEAPGAQEDLAARPFVGKAGALLDRLLQDAGVTRAEVAVANVIKCRPPDNRAPTRAEVRTCRGWLDRQVELVDPPLLVAMGGTALAWALGPGRRLRDERGRIQPWNGRSLLLTYHPSAAIRFGPKGEPMAALREDIRLAAEATCVS